MKIVSRPDQNEIDEMYGIGDGENVLRLTDDQFELVLALVCMCRLGNNSKYCDAAFELGTAVDKALGPDAMMEAFENVGAEVTIEDDTGSLIFESDSSHTINIEV